MTRQVNICADCKFYHKKWFCDPECTNPEVTKIDMVTGEKSFPLCKYTREALVMYGAYIIGNGKCGKDGRLYEAKQLFSIENLQGK